MRLICLSLAIVALAGGSASATEVCEALDGEEGDSVTLSGTLSFEEGEFYISQGGCRMLVSVPKEKQDICPGGAGVTINGEVDVDYDFVTDDLIVYADEITCP